MNTFDHNLIYLNLFFPHECHKTLHRNTHICVLITDEVRANRVECVSVGVLYILGSKWVDRKIHILPTNLSHNGHSTTLCFTNVSFLKERQPLLSCVFFLLLSSSKKMSGCMQGWKSTGQSPSQTLLQSHTHTRVNTHYSYRILAAACVLFTSSSVRTLSQSQHLHRVK